MAPGKAASQAGHAFLDTFLLSQQCDPSRCTAYRVHRHGTKIVLAADCDRILHAFRRALHQGLPAVLVVDEGCPDFFDGKPTLTALGAGPLTRTEAAKLFRNVSLLR
jgi:peptidyl-tRNA hydrolase